MTMSRGFSRSETKFIRRNVLMYRHFKKNAKVSKGVNIRNRYNQVPHLTQDTNGKVTNS